jgi:hypothetical protein
MKTKICSQCQAEKPLEEYHRGKVECKACSSRRRRAYRLMEKPNPVGLPPGVISLKEAAETVLELTGIKCSIGKIRFYATKFRHLGEWTVRNDGGDRFVGIIKARLTGLIKNREWAKDLESLFGDGL